MMGVFSWSSPVVQDTKPVPSSVSSRIVTIGSATGRPSRPGSSPPP